MVVEPHHSFNRSEMFAPKNNKKLTFSPTPTFMYRDPRKEASLSGSTTRSPEFRIEPCFKHHFGNHSSDVFGQPAPTAQSRPLQTQNYRKHENKGRLNTTSTCDARSSTRRCDIQTKLFRLGHQIKVFRHALHQKQDRNDTVPAKP